MYPFAGTFRTVDMSKAGEIAYATAAFLKANADKTWRDVNERFATRPESLEAFFESLAESMGDLHVLHPFREGNTRTLQLVAREIAWRAGFNVQWAKARPDRIRDAGTAAALGDDGPYIAVLRAITVERGDAERTKPILLQAFEEPE